MDRNTLGRTDLRVTPICIGTSALGGAPSPYGYDVDSGTAVATIRKAFNGPFNFIDTSNEYGQGESERRIGKAIAEHGGLPEHFVLATKVDPKPGTRDFSGARVRRSVEESLDRLGLERLPLVYLHDPERITFEEANASGGPMEALLQLRDEGLIRYLGVAGGPIDLERRYIATDHFDVVISHNRFTLVDQTAEPLVQDARARGVAFINAAPFGGGILAKGPDKVSTYRYEPAGSATLERIRRMQQLCNTYAIPLAAAALQFSLLNPRISSTIVGMSNPQQITRTAELAAYEIPAELWDELRVVATNGGSDH